MKKEELFKKMKNLSESLFDINRKYIKRSMCPFFPQSNETGMDKTITDLLSHEWAKKPKNTLRFAMVIGEGAVLSLAPVFEKAQIDGVFCADINPAMIGHMGFWVNSFKTAKNPQAFQKEYLESHPLIKQGYEYKRTVQLGEEKIEVKVKLTQDSLGGDLKRSKGYVKQNHFLEEKIFLTYQNIIKSIAFCPFYIDITQQEEIENFLFQVRATFLGYAFQFILVNATNVFDYDAKMPVIEAVTKKQKFTSAGNLEKSSKILFGTTRNPIIMYSTQLSLEADPISTFCVGMEAFSTHMKKYTQEINQAIAGLIQVEEKASPVPQSLLTNNIGKILRQMSSTSGPPDEKYLVILQRAQKEGLIDARGTSNPNTALHWAAKQGHSKKYELLIQYGADKTLKDKEGGSSGEELFAKRLAAPHKVKLTFSS